MTEAKRFKQALWEKPESSELSRIRAREITEDGSRDVIVDRTDTAMWEAVLAEFSEEEITKATDEDVKAYREKRDGEEIIRREAEERQFQEELFKQKIEIYELPEIKDCTDKKLKRRIRKAKNFPELYIYAAAVVMHEDLKNNE